MTYRQKDEKLQRCMDLSAALIHAAYDKSKPVDRDLAISVSECVAYLLSRLNGELKP